MLVLMTALSIRDWRAPYTSDGSCFLVTFPGETVYFVCGGELSIKVNRPYSKVSVHKAIPTFFEMFFSVS